MDYQCILGGMIASSLVLVFVLYGSAAKKKKAKGSIHAESNGCSKTSENGISPQEVSGGSTDIIIVGAGVAGAALAFTLGKVQDFSSIFVVVFLSYKPANKLMLR